MDPQWTSSSRHSNVPDFAHLVLALKQMFRPDPCYADLLRRIDFSEGLAAIRVDGRVGFMDNTGNVVIEPKYDDVYPFSDDLAPVQLGGEWGYVDKTGDVVVPIQYQIGHMFSEGLASVELGGKWGYIDRSGRFAIPAAFDSAMPFCDGIAGVETFHKVGEMSHGCRSELYKGKHGMIDHAGNYVWRDAEEQTWPSPICN